MVSVSSCKYLPRRSKTRGLVNIHHYSPPLRGRIVKYYDPSCYYVRGIVPWTALKFWTGMMFPLIEDWSVGRGWFLPSLLGDTNPLSDACMAFLAGILCSPPMAANSLEILPLAKSCE